MPRGFHGGRVADLAAASGFDPSGIIDASANLNPLGPPRWLDSIWDETKQQLACYPDTEYRELRHKAAESLGVAPENLVFGNGADELFYAIASVLKRRASPVVPFMPGVPAPESKAVIVEPCYASYREALEAAGIMAGSLFLRRENEYRFEPEVLVNLASRLDPGSSIWFGRPNNPTGLAMGIEEIATIADASPGVTLVVDEAFLEFLDSAEARSGGGLAPSAALLRPNIVVVRSITKFWAVPGIRLGYLIAEPSLALEIREALPVWPVSTLAERFGLQAFADTGAHFLRTRHLVDFERRRLRGLLAAIPGLAVFPGDANFVLCCIEPKGGASGGASSCIDEDGGPGTKGAGQYGEAQDGCRPDAPELATALAARGIGIRDCSNYPGLDRYHIRIGVRRPDENDKVVAALRECLDTLRGGVSASSEPGAATDGNSEAGSGSNPKAGSPSIPKARAKAIMVQGCSSSAGKSLIAAGLCRIFRDLGFDVAPYKAQNMSLNSAVTSDGLEIGRAQALQAAACGLEPDVRMNPVLLKPAADTSSQLIVMGKAVGHLEAQEYYSRGRSMREAAYRAYDSLAAEHGLIVLEGAGSPGEINLKRHDFVNMRAAFHAGARVLLVGDIDRGGVFASFIGHVTTFAPAERELLSGFIVNKFRGDRALLGDAFSLTKAATGIPVLGCIPWIRDLCLPDEDEPKLLYGERPASSLSIAVIQVPHVSNFTDLDPLDAEPDLSLVPVATGAELASRSWDAIIIPGSKATVADLAVLRERGFEGALRVQASQGVTIFGICGGLQMLGSLIVDPDAVESSATRTDGFGLLPVMTSFARDKTLRRAKARHLGSGFEAAGYEIHHGETWIDDDFYVTEGKAGGQESGGRAGCAVSFTLEDGSPVGWSAGTVHGSYLHGIFDMDAYRGWFLDSLRSKRGLPLTGAQPFRSLDAELDRLAAVIRESCDIDAILRDAGLRS